MHSAAMCLETEQNISMHDYSSPEKTNLMFAPDCFSGTYDYKFSNFLKRDL